MSEQSESEIPHCPNVLLSIEPVHADAILSGEKLWEYRRVAPARSSVLRLVLYASSPIQAAIGTAWVHTVKEDEPKQLVEDTVGSTPHTKEDVLDYFDGADTGYALRIGAYYRFDDPVPRENLVAAGYEPSQNFRYLGTVPGNPEAFDAEVIIPGMQTPDSDKELATDGGTAQDEADLEYAEPIYKRELLEKAKEAQEPVTEIEVSDKGRTTRVHAIQEYDGVAWRVMIRHYEPSDNPPSVTFAKSYHDSDAKVCRDWSNLATGRLGGPQDLPSWESLFTVFNSALGVYNREVCNVERR